MSLKFRIRPITLADARPTLEVYRPYIEENVASFEYELPELQEWETRIKTYTLEYPWLICEYGDQMVGYAYASKHRNRTAYSWSVESTVYLSDKFHRRGIARILYETLFNLLKLQGYVNVYAGITLPNIKSEAFHEALGFYRVGIFKKIGFKFGAWHDTGWYQFHLMEHSSNPPIPKTFVEVQNDAEVERLFQSANLKFNK
jgi:phosphinothricin acetyltransferase